MWHRQSEQEKHLHFGPEGIWLHFFKHLGLGDLIESQCEAHWDCNGICLGMYFQVKLAFEEFVRAS